MDADNSPARQAAPAQGGTVEPANRAPVAIAKFQTPEPEPGERYELRDPFAEVTYRANTFPDMVAGGLVGRADAGRVHAGGHQVVAHRRRPLAGDPALGRRVGGAIGAIHVWPN